MQASCEDKGYFGRAVNVQEISAVTAACMLMKVEDFEAVGVLTKSLWLHLMILIFA